MDAFQITVGAFLPLTIIVTTLTALNLERAVFNIMGGLHSSPGTANDRAYSVLVALTIFSFTFLIPLAVGYIGLVIRARAAGRGSVEAPVVDV